MILINLLALLYFSDAIPIEKIRYFEVGGKQVKTTIHVDRKFIGLYKGAKTGYLELKENGSGEYKYDIFGFAPPDCKSDVIRFDWGFLVDEHNRVVRFEREYGYSYPIIYKSVGSPSFQGCSKEIFVDYILELHSGELTVSSSDDWAKTSD